MLAGRVYTVYWNRPKTSSDSSRWMGSQHVGPLVIPGGAGLSLVALEEGLWDV